MNGRYIPDHIPWEFEEDVFTPMPWIPEGSLVSKNRFYEVRREQRPKSYSPPPTPPTGHDIPPLDALPVPAIIPPPTGGPTLKRSISFHPGGSQKLRREALVIDGRVTADTGFKLGSRSRESIVPSSSEPNNMDLIVRQLDTGHQSGLERLKNSMLRLMKAQPQRRYSTAERERQRSEPSLPIATSNKTKDTASEGTSHEPLAARRGLPVPSTLKLTSTHPFPLVSPYHPEIPTPFRGSPTVDTPLIEVARSPPTPATDKRESIAVEDMCTNLRCLVSPAILKFAGKEELPSPQSYIQTTDPTTAPDDAANGAPQTPSDDWTFASELERIYGSDPFSYVNMQERMPSFIRPLSLIPDVVTESTETQRSSGWSATSVSTFPEPPTDNLVTLPIPSVTISGGGPVVDRSSVGTRSSFPSSAATSDENLADYEDDETYACVVVSSTDTSPRSSEDKDEPLAIRRLTLLARSSAIIPRVEDFSSAGDLPSSLSSCSISLTQETLKAATKIVRFASETEEHTYLADPESTRPRSRRQRPRSSSVPPPQKGSLRNQTFLQRNECKDGRLSRSEPITFPSRIPKKRTFARIGLSGRYTALGKRSTETLTLDGGNALTPAGLGNANESRKRLSSLIPVPGLKATSAPSSLDPDKANGSKRVTGRNTGLYISLKQPSRTPTPRPAPPQQKTSLATSWSMTLRQYVKGSDLGSEKRQVSHSPPSKGDGELGLLPVSSVGTRDGGKSSLPVKKALFFRDGVGKATSASRAHDRIERQGQGVGGDGDVEGNAVGLVDKTGGISYIVPPKARATSRSRGSDKDGRKGPPTTGMKTPRPAQFRSLLGRFTG